MGLTELQNSGWAKASLKLQLGMKRSINVVGWIGGQRTPQNLVNVVEDCPLMTFLVTAAVVCVSMLLSMKYVFDRKFVALRVRKNLKYYFISSFKVITRGSITTEVLCLDSDTGSVS